MRKYFYFPMETMRVTQSYNGEVSHKPHTTGTPKDYPIDIAGIDGGQSAVFAPVDMKVTAIKGIGNSSTNTIWLTTTEPVKTPTFEDYAFITLTHWNDNDSAIKKHNKVGSIVKAGEIICYEGTDGASANHIHLTAGRGSSDGWTQNSNGKWVITGDTKKPEDVMYINPDFTVVKATGGINWTEIPKYVGTPVARDTKVNQIEVLIDNLRARDKGTTSGSILGYANKGIYNYSNTNEANGYVWYEIEKNIWIASNDGWTKVYLKEDPTDPSYEKKIKELEEEIANLQKEIEKLKITITEKDKTIKDLNNKIKAQEEQIKKLEDEAHYKMSYECTKTDTYAIKLNKGEVLIIK